ncbi:hypothetical protein [Xenorhabdus innexi]|uniref:Uncharacterized protein n=1 Tax=Xenorhabdus innexi TaxID=290109 RepID=A0A1N6MWY4_9GAMM|nr:hypothetical protein [Xenorhabdus innexi]PHM33296.1 hypothetical protein Xinn_02553 [Xenorhabdus innexi]SIP73287.1 conserved hypothetical protein [Xenorhabdus innexi]
MKRCEICGGYYGKSKKVNVGEKCCFTITTSRDGRSFNSRTVTGILLMSEKQGDDFSVMYRKKVYHTDHISHPNDPSPLALAFSESCNCPRH